MPNEPTKHERGACPNCGSKSLRRIREGENEAVIVQKRECRDCGTIFSPAVSPLLLLVTVPLALAGLGFAAWAAFINEDPRHTDMAAAVGWIGVLAGVCLLAATAMIVKQREPKIHETPRGPREAKPWDNPQGGEK
jgi:hypothetical protein